MRRKNPYIVMELFDAKKGAAVKDILVYVSRADEYDYVPTGPI